MSRKDRPQRTLLHVLLHVLLFVATLFTTTATGSMNAHPTGALFPLVDGLSFSLPLMAILLCHELGHYFTARYHGVSASLPFFIPLPPGIGFLGTMGAVIFQGGTSDRRKLIDIGASGPLAGLVVTLPVLWYGLAHSQMGPMVEGGMQEGNSILYVLFKLAITGRLLPSGGTDIFLHPTALAGWGGLFVTMLNLLPIGQLDGGHVATAYFGNRWESVAALLHRALPVLTFVVFAWVYWVVRREAGGRPLREGLTPQLIAGLAAMIWLVWFLLLFAMRRMSGGRYHPPVDETPLPRSRRMLFWTVAIAYALVFMPVPLRYGVGGERAPSGGPPPAPTAPISPSRPGGAP